MGEWIERLSLTTLPCAPVAKGRPRFIARRRPGGHLFLGAVTAEQTRVGEAVIAAQGRLAWQGRALLQGPIRITAHMYVAFPKSFPLWKRAGSVPQGKRDLDNYLKLLLDALNGVLWVDDRQIIGYRDVTLDYDRDDRGPRIDLGVEEMVWHV